MPAVITDALVLRNAEYRDYDRMVTLFSPEYGRVDAIARGCRRPKSPLLGAVEPFTSGEYQLFRRGERFSIDQCQIKEGFYGLRLNYDRLVHGVYWLKLLEAVLMPDTPMPRLFLTTLQALAHLTLTDLPPELLTMAFEMHLMHDLGYAPRMDSCVICQRPVNGDGRFDRERSGVVCMDCLSAAPRISNGARRILMKLPRTGYDKVPLVNDRPEWPEAARLFRSYIEEKLQTERISPPLRSEDRAETT